MYGPGDVRVEERDDPKIVEPTDAIIRLPATSICGSDLWPWRGVDDYGFFHLAQSSHPTPPRVTVIPAKDRRNGVPRRSGRPRPSGTPGQRANDRRPANSR
jgi:hypothetical protein